jgi:hypothetical protein
VAFVAQRDLARVVAASRTVQRFFHAKRERARFLCLQVNPNLVPYYILNPKP